MDPSQGHVRRGSTLLAVGLLTVATMAAPAAAIPAAAAPVAAVPVGAAPAVAAPVAASPGAADVAVGAEDVGLGQAYWQGNGTGDLVVTVRSTADGPRTVEGAYFLPAGVRVLAVAGADGCATAGGQAYTCQLDRNGAQGKVTVRLAVEPDAWQHTPLTGSVTATVGGVTTGDGFAVLLPGGPPTAGFTLAAGDLAVPVDGAPAEQALNVRLGNPGQPLPGAVEVVTPPGVDLVQYPPGCVRHRRISPNRERCELGTVASGATVDLAFDLAVTAQAAAETPLAGAVFGYLGPADQAATTVHTGYRILAAAPGSAPSAQPGAGDPGADPTASGVPADASGGPSTSQATIAPTRTGEDRLFGDVVTGGRIPAVAVVGTVVALVTLAVLLLMVSLRRRLRDDPAARDGGE